MDRKLRHRLDIHSLNQENVNTEKGAINSAWSMMIRKFYIRGDVSAGF